MLEPPLGIRTADPQPLTRMRPRKSRARTIPASAAEQRLFVRSQLMTLTSFRFQVAERTPHQTRIEALGLLETHLDPGTGSLNCRARTAPVQLAASSGEGQSRSRDPYKSQERGWPISAARCRTSGPRLVARARSTDRTISQPSRAPSFGLELYAGLTLSPAQVSKKRSRSKARFCFRMKNVARPSRAARMLSALPRP